jgi:phage terminase large subunit
LAQVIDLGYRPRSQFVPFHKRADRWSVVVAHRRCGKTVACIADLIDAALRCQKPNPRFAYIAPYFTQAKDVAFQYLKDMALRVPGTVANESELRVDFPTGARIRLYGVENADRLRGLYLDGVVLDEYADMDPRAWPEVIRPALSDRRGYAVFIGTPRGRNAFWEVWEHAKTTPNWFHLMLRASETGLIAPDELNDLRASLTPETFEQELECSFEAAILGAYYGREIADAERSGRVCDVRWEPALPVYTAWDLGIGDSTAVWFFQPGPDGVRFIDHYESHGQPLAHYAGVIAAKPYRVETDFVPHDAKVRELGTGRTRVETLKELGRNPRLVPNHKLEDGINAARVGFPRFWFDEVKCRLALEALRQYRTDYDEKLKAFKNTPKHDWTSHTADAFRYAAMAWRELSPEPKQIDVLQQLRQPKTLNQVLQEYDEELED